MRDLITLVERATVAPSPLDNPAFVSWFGHSKLVDGDGQPLVLYHGTSKDFDSFKLPGRGDYRAKAIFFTPDPEFASGFARWGSPNIMPCYVRAENPFDFRDAGHMAKIEKWLEKNHARVNPGALYNTSTTIDWLRGGDYGLFEKPLVQSWMKKNKFDSFYVVERDVVNIAVFTPNQAKSIYNFGEFSRDSDHVSESLSFLRELNQLDEAKATPFFDPAAIYLHGGPKALNGGALKRYGKNGGDMGGLFFTKDSPEGRAYAVSYTFGKDGAVYQCKINLPVDAVFDLQNPKHRRKLQAAVSPEEWSYFTDSQRGGQLDWAVVDEDQLGEAGFKGAILAERPPGVVSENFVYSVAVFDAAVVRIVGQMSPEEIHAISTSIARYDAR